jgi:tripartite-type tricarboxylate transporter receptor subunit TctC
LPGYLAVSWDVIVGPAGIPEPIANKISQAFLTAVNKPEAKKKIEDLGASVAPLPAREFKAFVEEDLTQWKRVARESNVFAK